ncbi:MAG: class I SAM-dependent methyltransferase [Cyanobacteria bacterium P01_F01_bin.150]
MTYPNWNKRYSDEEYVYGTEPNSFLVEYSDMLSNPVLSIAEGEGRNAVFLASRGRTVYAVDGSDVGLAKAQALASKKGVTIQTEVADLLQFEPEENTYGSIISIFAHLPSAIRKRLYPMLEHSLRKGGILLLEAYSEEQLRYGTGGPSDLDMLMTQSKIRQEFPNCEPILLRKIERDVCEGKFHTGVASVIQFIGRKTM